MNRNILALVDFSDHSRAALQAASQWSQLTDSELHIFHKVELVAPGFMSSSFKEELQTDAENATRDELKNFVFQAIGYVPSDDKMYITADRLLPEVEKLIQQVDFQLVFLGTKGKNKLSKYLFGSTVHGILDNFELNIAVIPDKKVFTTPIHISVAAHPGIPVRTELLRILISSLREGPEKLEFISINDDTTDSGSSETYLKNLVAQFPEVQNSNYEVFIGEDILRELKNYVKTHDNAVLIVQKGPRGLKDSFFRSFLVDDLVNDASIPLIILPET